ncbi:hypothetical protein P153DRAFT_279458 [Dothidotthia symphoricarpi CBS 119687]|uniref:Zn(2)-C6 fungal-type domain-containing protein n=1 Tax=Dothidotthia symphoricarpi CBS 119687 TaxID=1392245 RepID=A0A6A6AUY2_9PLEO|nr:uncharacterized protein P153DRAFT_279458 [Dothidotthia symphoricarpi CBS 119687]KAF2134677.1 hypothetical protein P153DRAFT_279458 [Dothidotthia symphoricarpi CBS 119687]
MNGEDQTTDSRAAPRTSQACQQCRSLKTKCLPSNLTGRCQRCVIVGRECAWAESSRRERKLKAPSRISEVENKLDSLVASLANPPPATLPPPPPPVPTFVPSASNVIDDHASRTCQKRRSVPAPGSWMRVPSSFEILQPCPNTKQVQDDTGADLQFNDAIHSACKLPFTEDAPEESSPTLRQSDPPIEDDLVKQLLASREADTLMDGYRNMSNIFPFVPLHTNMSGQELYAKNPMLFLAIITVALWRNRNRQKLLDAVYRKELAIRTIVKPQKTLGLVQSLLVYLSWQHGTHTLRYHCVFSHETQQIFFLHHLVIGLALDIGLQQDYQCLNFPYGPERTPPSVENQRERQRTFLGCYYLASAVATGLRTPNLLKYSPSMTEWTQDLKQKREYVHDEVISHLITLRQLDEQVRDVLSSSGVVNMDTQTLEHLETQLAVWKQVSFGPDSKRMLDLSSSFTDMMLHSAALRNQSHTEQQPTHDYRQMKARLSALEAGKRFLDTLLSFPPEQYHLISFADWMRLPAVIRSVAHLCIPIEAKTADGWNMMAAQDRVHLDRGLESLCYRMQSLTTYDKVSQPHPDYWQAIRLNVDLTRTWYLEKINSAKAAGQPSQNTQKATVGTAAKVTLDLTLGPLPSPLFYQTTVIDSASRSTGPGAEGHEYPMASSQSADFDMEQLFDTGSWGDGGYDSLAFGK